MPSTILLAAKLAADFPQFQFTASDAFHWSPSEKTVVFDKKSDDQISLLHELAHALLKHDDYLKDIQLLAMERDAWQYAKEQLCPTYDVVLPEESIQDALDTYRDWLHARSLCPECSSTGIQIKKYAYKCIACDAQWRVNDARICALRRYKL
jgi:hypothetical protein